MIEWGSPNWGGRVHLAENGSWVGDKHDQTKAKGKGKGKGKDGKDRPKAKPEQD